MAASKDESLSTEEFNKLTKDVSTELGINLLTPAQEKAIQTNTFPQVNKVHAYLRLNRNDPQKIELVTFSAVGGKAQTPFTTHDLYFNDRGNTWSTTDGDYNATIENIRNYTNKKDPGLMAKLNTFLKKNFEFIFDITPRRVKFKNPEAEVAQEKKLAPLQTQEAPETAPKVASNFRDTRDQKVEKKAPIVQDRKSDKEKRKGKGIEELTQEATAALKGAVILYTPQMEKDLEKYDWGKKGHRSGGYLRLNPSDPQKIELVTFSVDNGKAQNFQRQNLYYEQHPGRPNPTYSWTTEDKDTSEPANIAYITEVKELSTLLNNYVLKLNDYSLQTADLNLEKKYEDAAKDLKDRVELFTSRYQFLRSGFNVNEKTINDIETNVTNILKDTSKTPEEKVKGAVSILESRYQKEYNDWSKSQTKENNIAKIVASTFFNKKSPPPVTPTPETYAEYLNKKRGNVNHKGEVKGDDHHATRLVGVALQEIYGKYPDLRPPTSKIPKENEIQLEKALQFEQEVTNTLKMSPSK